MPRRSSGRRDGRSAKTEDLFELAADLLLYERSGCEAGYLRIAGLDEAGRGPLAGPVVAAAVVLPEGLLIPGVTDSKLLPEEERDRLSVLIVDAAVAWGVGVVDERSIDELNIYQATILAMERALEALRPQPDYLLIDALTLPRTALPQKALIKGDRRSHSIAAASIIAKVTRDRLMCELHERYPQYNFHKHKGYGTKEHLALLREHGPCSAHRRSFEPVRSMLRREP